MSHAGGHLRRMLDEYIDTGEVPVDDLYDPSDAGDDPVRWLTGQLWNCTDTLPLEFRMRLDCFTYGQAARAIRKTGKVVPKRPAPHRPTNRLPIITDLSAGTLKTVLGKLGLTEEDVEVQ